MWWKRIRASPPVLTLCPAALLLIALFAIPITSSGLRESLSVHFGEWEYWLPGYSDGGDWIPTDVTPRAEGRDGDLLALVSADDPKPGFYRNLVTKYPNDAQILALVIHSALPRAGVHGIDAVDFPYDGSVDPRDVRRERSQRPLRPKEHS